MADDVETCRGRATPDDHFWTEHPARLSEYAHVVFQVRTCMHCGKTQIRLEHAGVPWTPWEDLWQ